MSQLKEEALDIKNLINLMSESEKREAFTLLKGMLIGKELAQQDKEPA